MAAGKRQLKDRVTRIAKGGQTRAAALFQTSVETAEKEAVGDEGDL